MFLFCVFLLLKNLQLGENVLHLKEKKIFCLVYYRSDNEKNYLILRCFGAHN